MASDESPAPDPQESLFNQQSEHGPRHGDPLNPAAAEREREAAEAAERESREANEAREAESRRQAQIEAERDQLRAELAAERAMTARLAQQPSRERVHTAPTDPGPMPDSVQDPQGFARWMDARDQYREHQLSERILGEIRPALQQQQGAARVDRLWREFQDEHPEYRGAFETAQTAVQIVVSQRPDLAQNDRALKDAVYAQMQRIQGELSGGAGGSGGGSPSRGASQRTAGVSGGSRSARPAAPARGGHGEATDFQAELEAMRAEAGLA